MIGVLANPADHPVIHEFFQLFKTPWEFYREGHNYDVVLCAAAKQPEATGAKLLLTYAGQSLPGEGGVPLAAKDTDARILSLQGKRIPIYGDCVSFPPNSSGGVIDPETGRPAAILDWSEGSMRARIGYDLFGEVRTLLTTGQPARYAAYPTLELHIALLRELILASGAALVEIPPAPEGHAFIVCLTHDVDHPSIRRHKFDHTMFGFLYRATLGSLLNWARRRASVSDLLSNWAAAAKLPLVYLGLVEDFWLTFQDYPKVEKGRPSSFFVIPFKGRPGRRGETPAPGMRAAGYGAADIAPQIRNLMVAGCEVGLHGIDAWNDSSRGREELGEIQRVAGAGAFGARIHWLYFDEASFLKLEEAGVAYDSTIGYNETIGFRAGTTQVYKPLHVTKLLELPMQVMDTALFFAEHLNVPPAEAKDLVSGVIDQVASWGGCLTVNWHDRSIAPERQWGRFYLQLIDDLSSRGAWFATGSQAVAWFSKRRSVVFEAINWRSDTLHVKVSVEGEEELPPLQLHIHKPRSRRYGPIGTARECDIRIRLSSSMDTELSLASQLETESASR